MEKRILRSMLSVFIIVMMLTATVFGADWITFQQNNTNAGIVTDSAPIVGTNKNMIDLPSGSWNGIDVAPLMRTELDENAEEQVYAYIFLSTPTNSRVAKINVATRAMASGWGTVANGGLQIGTKGGFQLSTPVIEGDTMYIALSDQAQKLNNTTFDTDLSGWTTAATGGATIAQATDGTDSFAKINQTSASSATGSLMQTASLNASDKVRVTLRYKVENSTGATVKILAKKSSDSTYTEIYSKSETSTTGWIDVNTDVTTKFGSTSSYDIKYEAAFTPSSSGSVFLDNCGLMAENLMLKKIPDVTSSTPTVTDVVSFDGKGGQFNTPIKVDNGNLYLGSWKGGSTGAYYKVNLTGTPSITEFNAGVTGEGYYWAGAAFVPNTNFMVFGGDKSNVYVVNKSTMVEVARYSINGQESGAAEIRSAICYDSTNNKLYFTDKGGFLWCLSINTSTGVLTHSWHTSIGYSTSTPVVCGGKVYVGTGSFSSGTLHCRNASDGSAVWTKTVNTGGIQSSPIVYKKASGTGAGTYIYFTTNGSGGKGYCIKDNGTSASDVWETAAGNYTLQGMAAGSGYAVFGNDKGEVYIVND